MAITVLVVVICLYDHLREKRPVHSHSQVFHVSKLLAAHGLKVAAIEHTNHKRLPRLKKRQLQKRERIISQRTQKGLFSYCPQRSFPFFYLLHKVPLPTCDYLSHGISQRPVNPIWTSVPPQPLAPATWVTVAAGGAAGPPRALPFDSNAQRRRVSLLSSLRAWERRQRRRGEARFQLSWRQRGDLGAVPG